MATKKGLKKKTAAKKSGKRTTFDGDPPIIVGGGGSTYVWILKTASPGTLTPIANPAPDYPIDTAKYYCYDIPVNLGSYDTHNGNAQGSMHSIKKRRKHRTKFYKE